jgi:hypothetical protein
MEKSMKTLNRLAAAFAVTAALAAAATSQNLSVYFVRGNGGSTAAPMTLDEAVSRGDAKVLTQESGSRFTVENFSDRSLFIPVGTLLKGGLQDQVTSVSLIVPPHSGPLSLSTFCVDPFRSTKRDQEDTSLLAPTDTMIPSRVASLLMRGAAPVFSLGLFGGTINQKVVRNIRQAGIWWSIDTTRVSLSRALGVEMEPSYQPHWEQTEYQERITNRVLADSSSPWKTSLVLSLENPALRDAEATYVDALANRLPAGDDVIGAVFVVNGTIEGAEVYQSRSLFAAMWPKLLRTYAVAAIAADSDMALAAPPADTIGAFLEGAADGRAREGTEGVIRDGGGAVYTETRAADGAWVNRSFVATGLPLAVAASPEATVLGLLDTGMVGNQPFLTLSDRDQIVLHRADTGWTMTVVPVAGSYTQQLVDALAGDRETSSLHKSGIQFLLLIVLGLVAMSFRALKRRRASPWHERRRSAVVAAAKAVALALVSLAATVTARTRGVAAAVATRVAAAWAAWPPEGLVAALARNLGPAWPGNFRQSSRHAAMPTQR